MDRLPLPDLDQLVSNNKAGSSTKKNFSSAKNSPIIETSFKQNQGFRNSHRHNHRGKPPNFQYRNHHNQNRNRNRKAPVFVDFCHSCDRGFKNLQQKEEHFAKHVKCKEPGCKFESCEKLMERHFANLHGPNKILINIDDEEWRKQRKMRFPTIARIQQKTSIKLERESKGAVLTTQSLQKSQTRKQVRNRKRNHQSTLCSFPMAMLEKRKEDTQNEKSSFQNGGDNPMDLLITVANEKANAEEEKMKGSVVAKLGSKSISGLTSLMASYSDSATDEDDADDSTAPPPAAKSSRKTDGKVPSSYIDLTQDVEKKKASDELAKEKPHSRKRTVEKRARKDRRNKDSKSNKRVKTNKNNKQVLFMCQPSLSQKLHAAEINQERNTILQCVRFIVNNNFLQDS